MITSNKKLPRKLIETSIGIVTIPCFLALHILLTWILFCSSINLMFGSITNISLPTSDFLDFIFAVGDKETFLGNLYKAILIIFGAPVGFALFLLSIFLMFLFAIIPIAFAISIIKLKTLDFAFELMPIAIFAAIFMTLNLIFFITPYYDLSIFHETFSVSFEEISNWYKNDLSFKSILQAIIEAIP